MEKPLILSLKNQSGMCIIDNKYSFNFDNPGPVEIDIDTLSPQGIRQCVYNINRGILVGENIERLQNKINAQLPPPTVEGASQQSVPVRPRQELNPAKAIDDDLKQLKSLLRGTVETVIKEASSFRAARLRRLKDLEKEGQNRKEIIEWVDWWMSNYQKSVSASVGSEDVGNKHFHPGVKLGSPQITDIIDTEVTQVVIGEHEGA